MIDREVNSVREIERQTFTIVIDRTAVTEFHRKSSKSFEC